MIGFLFTAVIFFLIVRTIIKKGNEINNPFGNVIITEKEGFANTPEMYNQSINKLANEVITEELKQQGYGMFDSTMEVEIKKSILGLIVGVIFFIANMMLMFRINDVIAGLLMFATIIPAIIMVTRYNLKKSIYKQFQAREDENMEYIINSMIQRKVNRIPFILGRILIIIGLFFIPYIAFNHETFIYEKTNGGYALRYYVGSNLPENIEVPSEYKGEPVVEIRGNVFRNLPQIKSVKLPNTITSIRGKAFQNDVNLETIELPENLTELGGSAFQNCTSLVYITIPEKVKEIHGSTFQGDTSLVMVELPKELDTIGGHAFDGCTSLENIGETSIKKEVGGYAFYNTRIKYMNLEEGVTQIHEKAFANTAITNITLPTTIKKIGPSAFEYSTLMNINLNEGLEEISESAFEGTLIQSISIPDSVTKISAHVFENCRNLEKVKLSKNITEIKASTFRNTAITSIDIPEGVTRIGERAFRNCSKLTNVNIPSTVTSIEDSAFRECKLLTTITIPEGTNLGEKVFKDSPTKVKYR